MNEIIEKIRSLIKRRTELDSRVVFSSEDSQFTAEIFGAQKDIFDIQDDVFDIADELFPDGKFLISPIVYSEEETRQYFPEMMSDEQKLYMDLKKYYFDITDKYEFLKDILIFDVDHVAQCIGENMSIDHVNEVSFLAQIPQSQKIYSLIFNQNDNLIKSPKENAKYEFPDANNTVEIEVLSAA